MLEWPQPGVLVYMTNDGMATVWNADILDQPQKGHSMTNDGMVTAWSAGTFDQRWNGLSLECWHT